MIIIIMKRKAVRFIADDQALFVSGLGLILDATPALGAPRSKVTHPRISSRVTSRSLFFFCLFVFLSVQRFVIIANDDAIETVLVEENAGELTQTEASKVLGFL